MPSSSSPPTAEIPSSTDTTTTTPSSSSTSSPISNLDKLVLSTIRSCPNRTIRPAKLATLLGISIDDASAELCGLLSAVGGGPNGASFSFETLPPSSEQPGVMMMPSPPPPPPVMVFTFPPDFEKRARRSRRREDWWRFFWDSSKVCYEGLKIVIAFGLILSLFVLVLACVVATVVIVVAMLTQQRGRTSDHRFATRRLRSLIYVLKELMWCYALFGNPGDDDVDGTGGGGGGGIPFFYEVSVNLSFFLNYFLNPFSFGWWWRHNLLSQRRAQMQRRRWGGRYLRADEERRRWDVSSSSERRALPSSMLVPSGRASSSSSPPSASSSDGENAAPFRGLLSIIVEFLFGPPSSNKSPHPSPRERWSLRARVIASRDSGALSLKDLVPYADNPLPGGLFSICRSGKDNDDDVAVREGLIVVAHFNGVPAAVAAGGMESGRGQVVFRFPELLAEAEETGIPMPKNTKGAGGDDDEKGGFLYDSKGGDGELMGRLITTGNSSSDATANALDDIPQYLHETKYAFTKLPCRHFSACIILGAVNYVGMSMLKEAISVGGILELPPGVLFIAVHSLVSVLRFYAKMFFVIPTGRLMVLLLLNSSIAKRNRVRKRVAGDIMQSQRDQKSGC